ncbi:sensor histidine kinase [Saccharothrix obliqua]|uniref:sensor histidine kinase n=1 Tax=Saccharothrix obliqua TaxID=2861747 RepID=UPI001C5FCADA|nr:sensor domain-containing protein [Saccharothrix obliqua]MBW4722071.1 sensor domain-containing protein [Saccharothrix obliqua]
MIRPTLPAALRRKDFLLGWWPWRALGYVAGTVPVAVVAAVPIWLLAAPVVLAFGAATLGTALLLGAFGSAVLFGALPQIARPLARLERRRLRLVAPDATTHPSPGGYRDPATWREVGYAVLLVTLAPAVYAPVVLLAVAPFLLLAGPVLVATVDGPVAVWSTGGATLPESIGYAVAGLVLLPAVPYLVALLAHGHAAVARALLADDARLVEVTRSRARLVDAFDAERRRIERDLHDGAQEKLVSLTLRLGVARLDLPADSPAHRDVVDAHEQAKALMTELRELVRGIHPKVLTDRGLGAALEDLAGRCAVPVTVRADVGRLPRHVESTAYFVAAEALTNATRHGTATAITVTADVVADALVLEVTDDGRGGAVPGDGLTGLADRVAVLDGRMVLSSPVGGPTSLRVELPCHRSE